MSSRRWMLLSFNAVLACVLAYVVMPAGQTDSTAIAERPTEFTQPSTKPTIAPQRIVATRPLFQSAPAQPITEAPSAGAPVGPEFTVVGIAAGPEQGTVLIRTESGSTIRLRHNETFEGWSITHLAGKQVTFANGATTATLSLYERNPEP